MKKVNLNLKIDKNKLREKLEIVDPVYDTAEQLAEKMNILRNALDFRVLTNVPDFILSRDIGRGDQGSGGGSIIGFRDSTGATISQYVTALQFGTGISTAYSGGVITLTSAGGVTSFNTRTGAITLTTGDVTTALGFTPYNATNPSGYITSSALSPYLTSSTAASTYVPYTGATGDVDLGAHGLTTTALNVNGSILQNSAYAKFGNASPFLPVITGVDIFGSDNTINGVQAGVGNRSNGTSAYAGFYINNDLASDGLVDHYVFIGLNSSTYTDTTFGTVFGVANQLNFQNTDGPVAYVTNKTGATGAQIFYAGGTALANEVFRIQDTGAKQTTLALGTTQLATSGLTLTNTTAAASGLQQISPAQHFFGKGWATNAGGASQPVEMAIDMLPVQGAASPSATMRILFSANGGAYTTPYLFNSGGGFTCSTITTSNAGTQSLGGVTINIGGNGTTTTANIQGGATVNTAVSTVNINQGATASGGTKTTNIGTQGLAGSTTNITMGSTAGTSTTTFNGTSIFTSTFRLQNYTVATLPAGTRGDRACVTDATAPTYGAALTGGGAVVVPVFYNGAAWISA